MNDFATGPLLQMTTKGQDTHIIGFISFRYIH